MFLESKIVLMKDIKTGIFSKIILRRIVMSILETIMHKILIFEKEPQRVGLSQFKEDEAPTKKSEPSIKSKNVKLSDLMRRAS